MCCYQWHPVQTAAAPLGAIRVHLMNGAQMDADLLRRGNDTLYLRPSADPQAMVEAMPLAAVRSVDRRGLSYRRTALLAGGVALSTLIIVEGAMNYAQTRNKNIY
jgi:hypothetical protein